MSELISLSKTQVKEKSQFKSHIPYKDIWVFWLQANQFKSALNESIWESFDSIQRYFSLFITNESLYKLFSFKLVSWYHFVWNKWISESSDYNWVHLKLIYI